eukprot:2234373-Prymnesium_polylepis.2
MPLRRPCNPPVDNPTGAANPGCHRPSSGSRCHIDRPRVRRRRGPDDRLSCIGCRALGQRSPQWLPALLARRPGHALPRKRAILIAICAI